MSLPLFYHAELNAGDNEFELSEENTRHIISVLRMKKGDLIELTDGNGLLLKAEIEKVHKKNTRVVEKERNAVDSPSRKLSLAVSLIKNSGRFEWLLEKCTEIGMTEIVPMICERTEKEKFRMERMRGICISAMIQSRQVWMPILSEPVSFQSVIEKHTAFDKKFVAHCLNENKTSLSANLQGSYQIGHLLNWSGRRFHEC